MKQETINKILEATTYTMGIVGVAGLAHIAKESAIHFADIQDITTNMSEGAKIYLNSIRYVPEVIAGTIGLYNTDKNK